MTRTMTLCLVWLVSITLAGCGDDALSVSYDQLYVPCDTDADCPREASECRSHRFYNGPNRSDVVAFRQCSRQCSGLSACRNGTVSELEGERIILVRGLCLAVDESGVFDDSVEDGTQGYCLDGGNSQDPTLSVCPTRGTTPTDVFGGTTRDSYCLPQASPMPTLDASL